MPFAVYGNVNLSAKKLPLALALSLRIFFGTRAAYQIPAISQFRTKFMWIVHRLSTAAALDGRRRGETLTLQEMARLSEILLISNVA